MQHLYLAKNTLGRDFVVGDLHGCYLLFQNLLDRVDFDASRDRVFSVGDLVNRGPDSLKCFELVKQPWFFSVLGNHEDMMFGALDGQRSQERLWNLNGGSWALDANNFSQESFDSLRAFAKGVCPPLVITVEGSFHVVHAEFACSWLTNENIGSQQVLNKVDVASYEPSVIWGRSLFRSVMYNVDLSTPAQRKSVRRAIDLNKADQLFSPDLWPIFSGHTMVKNPTQITKQINLDTGAFLSTSPKANYLWAGLTMCDWTTQKFYKATTQEVVTVDLVVI